MSDDDKENYMIGIIMAQYRLKAGLKRFGIKGGNAVNDKLPQLHDKKIYSLWTPKQSQRNNKPRQLLL